MVFRNFKLLALALVALVPAGLAVAAAPSIQTAIAQRQAGFKAMGAAMKVIGDQLKTDAPSKAAMARAAQTISTNARAQARLFPAGSGPGAGFRMAALASIWTDRATFDAQMARLVVESGQLVTTVNGGDATAIRAQLRATGGTCSACHRQFRAES